VVTNCVTCPPQPAQGANFVYLHTAPDPASPLIGDPALQPVGTTVAADWSDKAVAGTQLVVMGRQGDWVEVDFGGQPAWIENPSSAPVLTPSSANVMTPRAGNTSIPVFGNAVPFKSAYPASITQFPHITHLQYTIPAGQKYVIIDRVGADWYYSPTMTNQAFIQGGTPYYQIFFNHRFAYVRVRDVTVKGVGLAR
jgi:hypothetical protein